MWGPVKELKALIADTGVRRSDEEFTLSSGQKSNWYIDGKSVLLSPEGSNCVGKVFYQILKFYGVTIVGGMTYGGAIIGTAVATMSTIIGSPMDAFFVRTTKKEHGLEAQIDASYAIKNLKGGKVGIVEDVSTTGQSAGKAIDVVQEAGAEVKVVVTMVDRGTASEFFKERGILYIPIYKVREEGGTLNLTEMPLSSLPELSPSVA